MPRSHRILTAVVMASGLLTVAAGSASASTNWTVARTGGAGEGQSNPAPSAPANPGASCVSSTTKMITVTWSAVSAATSYTVYKSTTASSGPYTSAATGVTGTSWTSGTLANGNYWFEVAAIQGTHWLSPNSSPTPETTTSGSNPKCTQP